MPLELSSETLKNLESVSEIKNIPFYPQVEDQCGPSSLATMLDVQGVKVSPEQLRGKLYIPGKEGSVTTELIARARRFGLLVYPLEPELVNILSEINAGNPVLVMQNLGFNWLPMWHFTVAIGYDLKQREISLRSGAEFKHQVDFGLFQKTWSRADSWAIVIMSPDKLPQTATAEGMIHAANQLERVGEAKAALQSYRSILLKWPEENVANFGAGNAAYALGEYQLAAHFFLDYLKLKPNSSIAWNNLAYSLAERACIAEANKAINCALALEPRNKNLLESAHEIMQYPVNSSSSQCEPISCVLDRKEL